jgi:hypothetical protein
MLLPKVPAYFRVPSTGVSLTQPITPFMGSQLLPPEDV